MNKLISSILMFTLTVSGQEYGVDFNNDGRLDRSEFYWAFPNQDLYETFDRLDLNKDGFIDQAEQERDISIASPIGKQFAVNEDCRRACAAAGPGWKCPVLREYPLPKLWICQGPIA